MAQKFKVKSIKNFVTAVIAVIVLGLIAWGIIILAAKWNENRILKEIVRRLSAETRVAEVLVTSTSFDETSNQLTSTVKFLEFDALGRPLNPKYFTFKGNVIQFQSLVIRFKDNFIETGDKLKGKSAFIFLKAFVLDEGTVLPGEKNLKTGSGNSGKTVSAQVLPITQAYEIPDGYKIPGTHNPLEKKMWEKFWKYALDPLSREADGIKSVQLEAPGSVFVPGTIYTLKIEHDGGLRIDSEKIPEILKGEKL